MTRTVLVALCLVALSQAIHPVANDVSQLNLPEWVSRSNKVPAETNLVQSKPGIGDLDVPAKLPDKPPPADPLKAKLSVAGKVFLALLGLFFAVELITFVCGNLLAKPLDASYFAKARASLVLVPVFSVLILFVMFRAKKQGIDQWPVDSDSETIAEAKKMYGTMQAMYVVGMIGIYVQVLDAIDISITSNAMGNLSSKLGPLAVTIGFLGGVYGALYVRDTSIPLSTSAECISYTSSIFLLIQLGLTFMTYKKDIPGMDKIPTGDDSVMQKQLDDALMCCKYVPHAMIIFFFWYLLAEYAGFELQSWAQNCMYLAVWGIVLQAIGCFAGGKLGKFLRMLGVLLMFVGLGALIFTAFVLHQIGLGPYTNLLTAIALGLVGTVIIFSALIVMGTDCSDSAVSEDKVEVMKNVVKVLDYAVMLSILMLYLHFRALMIGADIPEFIIYAAEAVCGALLLMCLLMALSLPAAGAILLAVLYIGFGFLVLGAFLMKPGAFTMPDDMMPDLNDSDAMVMSIAVVLFTLCYLGSVVTRIAKEVPEDAPAAPAAAEEDVEKVA